MNTINETVLTAGSFQATVTERTDLNRFPLHKFACKIIQQTPKAKYMPYKLISNYVYKTYEEAIQAANNYIGRIKNNIDSKQKAKEELKQASANIKASDFYKIGDILYNSWGYDQTNIDWYQVTEVKNKTIVIKRIAGELEQRDGYSDMSGFTSPIKDRFIKDGDQYTLRVKASNYSGHSLSSVKSYYYFSKWGGSPKYCSWYA